nr:uncharacterized protein LOC110379661 [Helicoverpa armigera]
MNNSTLPGTCGDNMIEVSGYQSESESETEITVTKKPKKTKDWTFLKQFSSKEDALNFVNSECTWSRNYTRATEDGQKRFYRCNKVKKRGPQCDAELYLLFVNDDDKVKVYQTNSEHNHSAIGTRDTYGIHENTKEEIKKFFNLRLKPRAILSELAKIEGIHLPSKRQIYNYLSNLRAQKFGKSGICLGELEQWIFKRTAIPEDDNEVFIISYHIIEGDQPGFRFNLSTKTLLKTILFTELIHTDATYKLIWQGFPVLIVGTTDKNREFHPICLGVATNEHQEVFQTMFQGIKDKVMQLYNYTMKPRVLICDAAQSIKNAFSDVFGEEPTIRMCWAQAKINIQKKVEQIVPKKEQKSVLIDVEALHNAASLDVFNAASQAFLEKWKTQTTFVKYMEEEWFRKNRNWFLGAAPMSPSTNNALESFNRNIKDHNTLREQFPLSRFLSVATDMVAQWSLANSSLPEAPTIELRQWTEAYVWAKKSINIEIVASDPTKTVYLICNENATDLNYNDRWQTFDEYKKLSVAFQKTTLPNLDWQKGSCDCPEFFNRYVCKHVLGLAIRLKLTTPPLEAKRIPIGQKRKRGRPAKSKPALIYQ